MDPQGALNVLLDFAFTLYTYIVLTRFVLQLAHADFYNPISQVVVRVTNPLLVPLRRVVPGWRGLDVASLVLVVLLIIAKLLLLTFIHYGALPADVGSQLLVDVPRVFASLVLNYAFGAVLARVILSWVAPDINQPVTRVVVQITEPIMAPVRRLLPPMGGLDLSPMLILLAVYVLERLFQLNGL